MECNGWLSVKIEAQGSSQLKECPSIVEALQLLPLTVKGQGSMSQLFAGYMHDLCAVICRHCPAPTFDLTL